MRFVRFFLNQLSTKNVQYALFLYFLLLIFNSNAIPLFIGDENYYVTSTRSLMEGVLDKNDQPLLAKTIWMIGVGFFYILTGNDQPTYWRIFTIFLSLGTLIFFYKTLRLYLNRFVAICGVVLLAIDPMYFTMSRIVQLDVPALFFFTLFLYFFLN